MNKNEFWDYIEPYFDKSENEEIATVGSAFGYIDKETHEGVEIDYKALGLDFDGLVSLLIELDADGLVEFINTNNMVYIIHKR